MQFISDSYTFVLRCQPSTLLHLANTKTLEFVLNRKMVYGFVTMRTPLDLCKPEGSRFMPAHSQ